MKTNRNKIVSFAADFKKVNKEIENKLCSKEIIKDKYEEIYNRNIGDASIHQYDVSRG